MPTGSAVALMKPKKRGRELPIGNGITCARTNSRTSSNGRPSSGTAAWKSEASGPTLPKTGRARSLSRCSATASAAARPSRRTSSEGRSKEGFVSSSLALIRSVGFKVSPWKVDIRQLGVATLVEYPASKSPSMTDKRVTETVSPETFPAESPRILAAGSEVGARYRIRSVLGMGGSSVVYSVDDRELRRSIALKMIRSDRAGGAALKRFRREVALARSARDERLIGVYDIGESPEGLYFTMELVAGETLRARLDRGPLEIREVLRIAKEVLGALEALHRLGIVHRDLKPGNVLLTPGGAVKVADFGLARQWDSDESRATQTDGVVGTLEYLSPEQALGNDMDARRDLHPFGVVLFEMLTGRLPLPGRSS